MSHDQPDDQAHHASDHSAGDDTASRSEASSPYPQPWDSNQPWQPWLIDDSDRTWRSLGTIAHGPAILAKVPGSGSSGPAKPTTPSSTPTSTTCPNASS